MGAPSVIVFDVNETLIDIESIGPFFERKFGDRKVLREWFNQLILYSNVTTLLCPSWAKGATLGGEIRGFSYGKHRYLRN
jgi:hypothetical protein